MDARDEPRVLAVGGHMIFPHRPASTMIGPATVGTLWTDLHEGKH